MHNTYSLYVGSGCDTDPKSSPPPPSATAHSKVPKLVSFITNTSHVCAVELRTDVITVPPTPPNVQLSPLKKRGLGFRVSGLGFRV
jgi:hypothetical protein